MAALALVASTTTVVAATGQASATPNVESMPLWRLQVRITTGSDGTTETPAVRLNPTSSGVRWLDPPSRTGFDVGRVTTYDLRLLNSPSEITMFRLGVTGTDSWCVKKVELLFNNRTAFAQNAVNGNGCATITGGTYVEFSSAALRADPRWSGYGSPPALPTGLSAWDLRTLVTDVTGTALISAPGISWDLAVPLTIVRKSASSVNVSYGVWVSGEKGDGNFRARISYDVQFFVGIDGRLHAMKMNGPCCYDYEVSDAVVAQFDTALGRMTAPPTPHDPLRVNVDTSPGITWAYVAVIG